MKEYFNDFLLILQFLTRIPVNKSLPCEMKNFRDGATFLPLIGLIIGVIQWGIYVVLIKFLPVGTVAVFVIIAGLIITGGLHIDGIGDTCDGFFALKGRDKIIEIMKDSRIGTFACIAIICDLLLRYSLLSEINTTEMSYIIIAVPVISRLGTLFLGLIGKCAKSTGTGNFFIGNIGKVQFTIALLITIGISYFALGINRTAIIIPSIFVITILFYKFCQSKIGGITGDSLGANNELTEILALILAISIK